MPSETVVLADDYGDRIEVRADPDLSPGASAPPGVLVTFFDGDDHVSMCLSGERLDAFREAVDRCVWCATCGARLWQGQPFSDEEREAIRGECERLGVPVGGASG